MNSRLRQSLLLLPVLFLISCQAATVEPETADSPSATTTTSQTPEGSPTAQVQTYNLSIETQREVLRGTWNAVNDQYLYEDFNGVDWPAIREEYTARIEAGLSDQAFYAAMDEMIAELGDGHSYFEDPEEKSATLAQIAGTADFVGIGILGKPVAERQRSVIMVVFPGSGAEEAGLRSRDSIIGADGSPILNEDGGPNLGLLRGPEGTQVLLVVQTPGEEPREVLVTRKPITGGLPTPHELLISTEGLRIGYIFIPTFLDENIDGEVGRALQELSSSEPLDGFIIDNRLNGGGIAPTMFGTLSYFMDGLAGTYVTRDEQSDLTIDGVDVNGSQSLPLVVMVGEDTVSYAEVFAGILQDQSEALILGETTLGNVEILVAYDLLDGSQLWLAHESFQPLNHPDANWEESGIIPDIEVIAPWDLYSSASDPAILAALDYFDSQP